MMPCSIAPAEAQSINIIPEPAYMTVGSGALILNGVEIIAGSNDDVKKVAKYLAQELQQQFGIESVIMEKGKNGVTLVLDSSGNISPEGYQLRVMDDGVLIRASHAGGLFYGVQTLLQLANISGKDLRLPFVTIDDKPRFKWRGVMLDVSRHFFSKEFVLEYIDQLARYKFNRLHLHLTDDQGWRIEIKSLPKLTEVGAWRVARSGTFGERSAPKPGEKATEGGFYTHDDIKEIVAYAKERFIEIIPEIDVPGHSMAAIASYPELCVTRDTSIQVNPGTAFSTWHGNGKFTMHIDNTLNPADENVYTFLDKVFTEVASLFPFEYIHIGGDECFKGYWERDAGVQAFMKRNNIKNSTDLQGYFTKRVSQIVLSKNKKVIGWDEIIESDLPAGVDVMSWRGAKGGIEAAHQKRNVVMSPNPVYYLDMCQGETSIEPPIYDIARLKTVYDYDLVPRGVDASFILGGQGNLWTEQVPTSAQVEYMTYPRALALAETFWSPSEKKSYNNFVKKVEAHFVWMEDRNINHATSMYDPIISFRKNSDNRIVVSMEKEVENIEFYYTADNTVPTRHSLLYTGTPVALPEAFDNFKVVAYRDNKPIGHLISLKREDVAKRVRK